MSEDVDVNDDGVPDLIVPTRPCGFLSVTPPPTGHAPHTNWEAYPNVTRCPGNLEQGEGP